MWKAAAVFVFAVAVIAACSDYSSGPDTEGGSVTGNYSGSADGTADGDPFTLEATFTLVEYLNGVTGTFTTDSGTSGTISGSVSGASVSFTITQTAPCAGSFAGTATVADGRDRLTGSYSGTSACTGDVTASFVVNRP